MKELNQQVLLSADFRERLPESEKLIDLGERKLKGKQQAVGFTAWVDVPINERDPFSTREFVRQISVSRALEVTVAKRPTCP